MAFNELFSQYTQPSSQPSQYTQPSSQPVYNNNPKDNFTGSGSTSYLRDFDGGDDWDNLDEFDEIEPDYTSGDYTSGYGPGGEGEVWDSGSGDNPFGGQGTQLWGWLQGLFNGSGGNAGLGSGGATLGSGMGAFRGYRNANEIRDARNRAVNRSDPFGSQRQGYQGLLAQSYLNPDFFENDPAFRGQRENAMNQTNRMMAGQGYNMSGNQLQELNRTGINEGYKYADKYRQGLSGLAGGNINPGMAGQLDLYGTQMAGQASANADAESMNLLANLFGNG